MADCFFSTGDAAGNSTDEVSVFTEPGRHNTHRYLQTVISTTQKNRADKGVEMGKEGEPTGWRANLGCSGKPLRR